MPVDYFDDDDEPEPWLDFTEDLAARLGDLKTGVFEFIELEDPERGWHGHLLTNTATSSGRVRCVVPNSALSHRSREEWNPYHQQFVAAGWRYQPRKHQHIRAVGRRAHHEAARQSVAFFREWWGVPYPWSLTLRDPNGSVHPLEPSSQNCADHSPGEPRSPAGPTATTPDHRARSARRGLTATGSGPLILDPGPTHRPTVHAPVRVILGGLHPSQAGVDAVPEPPQREHFRKPQLPDPAVFRVRIDLDDSDPPIWRTIELRSEMTLDLVHRAIQGAFGWLDYHLYRFALGGDPFAATSELFLCDHDYVEGDDGEPAVSVYLDETMHEPGDILTYVYDYGDHWALTLRLETVLPPRPDVPLAICVDGDRAAPPEDCGHLLSAEELATVLPDPAHFDIEIVAALGEKLPDNVVGQADGVVDHLGAPGAR